MPCCTASAACFCECQCPVSAGSKSFSRKCFPVSTRNLSDNFLVFMLDQPPGQTGLPPLYFDGLRAHDRQLACCQASKPPVTLTTFLNPARCSRLAAIMLRYPPLQCTATCALRSISGGATLKLSRGHHVAFSI